MNITKRKPLGITMLCELILYCIYSIIMTNVAKHVSPLALAILSCTLATVWLIIPVFIYLRLTKAKFTELLILTNDRTRKPSKSIITFIFALSITVSAVNVISLASEWAFSVFGMQSSAISSSNVSELVFLFIRNVLIAAVFEEILMRGVVLNATKGAADGKRVFISALLFALIHCNLHSFFYAFAAGAVIAYFTLKMNSVIFGIALHLCQNGITFAFTVLSQKIQKSAFDTFSAICFFVFLAIACIGILFTALNEHKMRSVAPKNTNLIKIREFFSAELIAFTVAASLITVLTF